MADAVRLDLFRNIVGVGWGVTPQLIVVQFATSEERLYFSGDAFPPGQLTVEVPVTPKWQASFGVDAPPGAGSTSITIPGGTMRVSVTPQGVVSRTLIGSIAASAKHLLGQLAGPPQLGLVPGLASALFDAALDQRFTFGWGVHYSSGVLFEVEDGEAVQIVAVDPVLTHIGWLLINTAELPPFDDEAERVWRVSLSVSVVDDDEPVGTVRIAAGLWHAGTQEFVSEIASALHGPPSASFEIAVDSATGEIEIT